MTRRTLAIQWTGKYSLRESACLVAQQTPPQPQPQAPPPRSVYEALVYRASGDNKETQEVQLLIFFKNVCQPTLAAPAGREFAATNITNGGVCCRVLGRLIVCQMSGSPAGDAKRIHRHAFGCQPCDSAPI